MTVAEYSQRPFQLSHRAYDSSCLSLGAQPEYATGDVLLGSCYRALGLVSVSESEVDLEDIHQLPDALSPGLYETDVWRFIFEKALRSPTRPGESASRPLPQLVPLVPSLAGFAGVLGRRRSRWNPGRLAIYALACGAGPARFPEVAESLAKAMDVTVSDDDQFAVFLEQRLALLLHDQRIDIGQHWQPPKPSWSILPYREHVVDPLSPAEAFAQDLSELLKLKPSLTRRQWCALVESLLRLALAAHVLWVSRLNSEVWRLVLQILDGDDAPTEAELERMFWSTHLGYGAFLDGGQGSDPYFKRQVESYAVARLGINLLMHGLGDVSADWTLSEADSRGIPAARQIRHFLTHLSHVRGCLSSSPRQWLMSRLGSILDEQSSKVSARSGSPKNLYEFLAHTLRRRPSKDPLLNEHDQGYLLTKLPGPRNAPWVVRPGPVLLMAMCYSTCRSMRGAPVTLQHLANRFSYYGIRLSTGDLQEGNVAKDLGALGVLVDSPDAGGGRLVLNPFAVEE